jgi:hypothetical protein
MNKIDSLWTKACNNVAAWIVAQARRNVMMWSPPGQSKTASTIHMARRMGREFLLLIGSSMPPEDVGGLPDIKRNAMSAAEFFLNIPPYWAHRLQQPGCILLADEFTCTGPATRAPLQLVFANRRIGQLEIHPDNWLMGAANPSKWAPNATPLEKAMANRFVHIDFKINYESWKIGMQSSADKFGEDWIPTLPSDWERYKEKWGYLITSYLDKNSNDREHAPPDSDEENSYPTYRSWMTLRDVLAAADSVGAPGGVMSQLAHGTVGKVVGSNLLRHVAHLDLVDVEAVLKGEKTYTFDRNRVDLASALLVSAVAALKQNYSEARLDAAVDLFCNNVGKHAKDLVLTQLKPLVSARPEGSPLPRRSAEIITAFGKTIPAEARPNNRS